jgi:hypothetical protein
MDGEAILIMVGEVTHLIIVTAAGPMVGAASTAAGVGDGDTITIITILEAAGIPVAVDTGEVAIGIVIMRIRTDAQVERTIIRLAAQMATVFLALQQHLLAEVVVL